MRVKVTSFKVLCCFVGILEYHFISDFKGCIVFPKPEYIFSCKDSHMLFSLFKGSLGCYFFQIDSPSLG